MTRIAVFQMTAGIDPAANAAMLEYAVGQAAEGGAQMLFTPEMSGLLDRNRKRAAAHVVSEADNPVLARVREAATRYGLWVSLGSLAIAREDGAWANRSFLIDPDGAIAARYDKIHMFDVALATGETWKESSVYTPGESVVAAVTPLGMLGLSICYDVRFPDLFSEFGSLACDVISVPAAFTVPTGEAHWHLLLRARAVEASAYIIAAAQVGNHEDGRITFGHSLVVDPWGQIILDMGGEEAGVAFAEIDPNRISEVRTQLPSLANRRVIPRSSVK